jgi:hypothetical protein
VQLQGNVDVGTSEVLMFQTQFVPVNRVAVPAR